MACSEDGVAAAVCSEAGDVAVVCSGPGMRTAGGSNTMVFRVTEERERAWGQKIAKCSERERGA
jgi:hypothetical protein